MKHPPTVRPYTWEEFEVDIKGLVAMVRAAKGSKKLTGIFAVPRGGLVPGVRLSHELDLPLIMGGVTESTLVVDDIVDTGTTLAPYRKRGCPILTLFRHAECLVTPTFHARENRTWVVFPWEKSGY
jgi:hypoxanthine phosphoribosyltransferase